MSAIVPVEAELQKTLAVLKQWEAGYFDNRTTYLFLKRQLLLMDHACFCDEDCCCKAHNKHSSPHQNCILR